MDAGGGLQQPPGQEDQGTLPRTGGELSSRRRKEGVRDAGLPARLLKSPRHETNWQRLRRPVNVGRSRGGTGERQLQRIPGET